MDNTTRESGPASIQTLFGEALRETSDLAQKEFTLFRTEMTQNVRLVFVGLALLVAAAVFAIAAVMLLTEALVEWLAVLLNSEALAALIVGGVMAVIAIGLGLYGRSRMSSFSLTPRHTVDSIKRDSEVLSERVSG
ncbi:phage holin family protein [Microvirga massiliensis]|jgi:disulfide bond formation protein DsbB|uniref:phage holin family protein n=1 Tax=Microvirga massiliensis TaxID=1033741 RepID=UPI00062BEE4A|nr:phage holin family protein [Microvirga massiliensis]